MEDIYRGETRFAIFNIQIRNSGSAVLTTPDLSSDSINFLMKKNKTDENSDAYINVDADTTTSGSTGTAILYLSTDNTDVAEGYYYYELLWTKATGEKFVLESTGIRILDRVYKL